MAALFLLVLVMKPAFEVLIRLVPLFPIPLVLALEWWAVSKYEFSRLGVVVFRAVYVVFVVLAAYATYVLAMIALD